MYSTTEMNLNVLLFKKDNSMCLYRSTDTPVCCWCCFNVSIKRNSHSYVIWHTQHLKVYAWKPKKEFTSIVTWWESFEIAFDVRSKLANELDILRVDRFRFFPFSATYTQINIPQVSLYNGKLNIRRCATVAIEIGALIYSFDSIIPSHFTRNRHIIK